MKRVVEKFFQLHHFLSYLLNCQLVCLKLVITICFVAIDFMFFLEKPWR